MLDHQTVLNLMEVLTDHIMLAVMTLCFVGLLAVVGIIGVSVFNVAREYFKKR